MIDIKTYDEICQMYSDDIRLEMLQIWHDIDFNKLTEEETEQVKEQLKLYRDILTERNYEYRHYN